jgi:hypothetical protein
VMLGLRRGRGTLLRQHRSGGHLRRRFDSRCGAGSQPCVEGLAPALGLSAQGLGLPSCGYLSHVVSTHHMREVLS